MLFISNKIYLQNRILVSGVLCEASHTLLELVVLVLDCSRRVLEVSLKVLDGAVHLLQCLLDRLQRHSRGLVKVNQLLLNKMITVNSLGLEGSIFCLI